MTATDLHVLATQCRTTADRMTATHGATSDIARHWQLRSDAINRRAARATFTSSVHSHR